MLKLQGWNTKESCFGAVPKPIITDFTALTTGTAIENYLTQNFGNTYNPGKSNISKADLATSAYGPSLWYSSTAAPINPVITFTFKYHIPKLVTLKVYTSAIGNTTDNAYFSVMCRYTRYSSNTTLDRYCIWANKSGFKVTTCQDENYMCSNRPSVNAAWSTGGMYTDRCLSTWNTAGLKTLWCYLWGNTGGWFDGAATLDDDLKAGRISPVDIVFCNPRTYLAAADGSWPAGNYTSRVYLNAIEFAYDI